MKTNCWEIKECGREENGSHAAEFGVCPAFTDTRLNGIHGGVNAGRACWMIAGTFCGGEKQGTFAKKEKNCLVCNVYDMVKMEEGSEFKMSSFLYPMIR